jgi:hypothetical protein
LQAHPAPAYPDPAYPDYHPTMPPLDNAAGAP